MEDFIRAAALVRRAHPQARFVVIGGPDAVMPAYAGELRALAGGLGLDGVLRFLGDQPGGPRLPVVATRVHGAVEQFEDGVTGLVVPHAAPGVVATALAQLIEAPGLRRRLGEALRRKVEREYSAAVVPRRWEALFDEVIAERDGRRLD